MTTDQDNPKEDEGGPSTSWKTWIPMIFLGTLFWLWYRDDQLCSTTASIADNCYPTFIVYTVFCGMFLFTANAWWWYAKLQSPHFVGNNIHGSITGRFPVSAGDFYITRLGSIDYGITTERFSNGTAIYPQAAYNRLGSQVAVPCRFEPRKIDELPHAITQVIRSGSYSPPYFYGDINEEDYKQVLDLIEETDDLKVKNELINRLGGLSKMNPGHLRVLFKEECKLRDKFEIQSNQLMGSADQIIDFAERTRGKAMKTAGVRSKIEDKFRGEKG